MTAPYIFYLLLLTRQSLSTDADWDYDTMSQWSDSFSMCNNQDQSPINIQSSNVIYDDQICNGFFDWNIQYDITNFQLTNNGHSIHLKPVTQSTIDPNHELDSTLYDTDGMEYEPLTFSENTIATFPNYFKPSDSTHEQFCFDHLHFHWGLNDTTGSEHFLNGYKYPLEAQFVHFSCKHASLDTTLSQFASEQDISDMKSANIDTHQLGIVGIFFDIIEDYINPAFETFLNDNINAMDVLPGHNNKIINGLNFKDLIPENIQTDGYYAYEGSLTTPPCTNIVRWHVMNATGKIGKSQMEKLRQLYLKTDDNGLSMVPIAPNYREIQNNVNNVYGCTGLNESVNNESVSIDVLTIAIISGVVTGIIIGIVSLFMKFRNIKKRKASNLTKSSSANNATDDNEHVQQYIEQQRHRAKQLDTNASDETRGNNRMSIDL